MVVRCVMPFAKFDQMEHVEVCALCDTLASGFIANFLQTGSFVMPCGHSSAITCFAAEFFFSAETWPEVLYMRVVLTCL